MGYPIYSKDKIENCWNNYLNLLDELCNKHYLIDIIINSIIILK